MPDSGLSFPHPWQQVRRSLAISVLIGSSRTAQILYAVLSGICLLVAILILTEQIGAAGNALQYAATSIACAAALRVGIEARKKRSSVFLDISGTGDLRFGSVQSDSAGGRSQLDPTSMPTYFLMAGSVINPFVLILRLADKYGIVNTLIIFPDSVSVDAFRRLSLACRWLAGQKKRQQLTPI